MSIVRHPYIYFYLALCSFPKGLIGSAVQSKAVLIMNGLDTEPMHEISRSFWCHNAPLLLEDSVGLVNYFALTSWGDVNDRIQLENAPVSSYRFVNYRIPHAIIGEGSFTFVKKVLNIVVIN